MSDKWFLSFGDKSNPPNAITLFCCHHAGGSAQFFRPWSKTLPKWINVVGIQLPGRWDRIDEAPYLDMKSLISDLGPAIYKYIKSENINRYVLYGHSLGALVCFELARYLESHNMPLPQHLFVSSRGAPQSKGLFPPIYNLTEDEFENALAKQYGGIPALISADPDMKKLFLKIAKGDMQIFDTYKMPDIVKINIPITAAFGRHDKAVNQDTIEEWSKVTNKEIETHALPGGHFFIAEESHNDMTEILENLLNTFR